MNLDGYYIDEVWNVLNTREKTVIEGRYLDGKQKTFAQIGKELGISGSYASLLEKQALHRMRERFVRMDNLSTLEELDLSIDGKITEEPRRRSPKPKVPRKKPQFKEKPSFSELQRIKRDGARD